MIKKGDTLIEVTLAVGIFSMIAVAIVAVMSSGTSGAQTALETTLAREEIDTQAEAIRFIHSAYIADKDSEDDRFAKLWKAITASAVELNNTNADNELLKYAPNTCAELYDNNGEIKTNRGFVINPRTLGTFTKTNLNAVFFSANPPSGANVSNASSKFSQASTYPHLIFGGSSNNTNNDNLVDGFDKTGLYKAEGIYVIAVKDSSKTNIIGEGSSPEKVSAFYDFYIRTCWYGSNADKPSTISTVIRLYNPDAI